MLRKVTRREKISRKVSSAIFPLREYILVVISSVFMILAFPRTDAWVLAWVGLSFLFLAIEGKGKRESFQWSYFSGFIFFVGTLYWLVHVTKVGVFLLAGYCALYYGLFGLSYYYFSRKNFWAGAFALPAVWVVLEYARGVLFSGFDWGSLGYSQYKNLAFIQIADVTGKYGISFLIVFTNLIVKEIISADTLRKQRIAAAGVLIGVLVLVGGYGVYRIIDVKKYQDEKRALKVAVIQGNIAQEIKWIESYYPMIIDAHARLSMKAALDKPDLIIWPETSFPGYWGEDSPDVEQIKWLVKELKTPLLFGSVVEKEDEIYYNSAVFLGNNPRMETYYHKMRLVPFGEFIPFRKELPWLSDVVPIADFSIGKEHTVFSYFPQGKFSVLICFEDSFADFTRAFVNNGAELLINLTNDAWFKDTKEVQMHLQASVLRAVENRRYFVRSANTGISGFIDPTGKVIAVAKDETGNETFVNETAMATVYFNDHLSFYTRFGDVFVILCAMLVLGGALVTGFKP